MPKVKSSQVSSSRIGQRLALAAVEFTEKVSQYAPVLVRPWLGCDGEVYVGGAFREKTMELVVGGKERPPYKVK